MNSCNGPPARMVVIGIPGSRRVRAFIDAVRRLGPYSLQVVSYLDAIAGRAEPPCGSLVRIESPSECADTARAILQAGIAPLEAIGGIPLSRRQIDRIACQRGEILPLRQWFLGFREILLGWQASWEPRAIDWMSRPSAIATAFDKLECLDRWSAAALPVPRRWGGIASYAELRRQVGERHARVFVKPRYGYSAVGAVAIEWRGPLVRAITTVEAVDASVGRRLFLSKRCRVLTGELEIARLIDTLSAEETLVEQWLSKARSNGTPFDVRVVVVGGRAKHVVGRANASPFTNLNLGASRLPRKAVAERLGPAWHKMLLLSEQAAAEIPAAGALGVDVIVRPDRRSFVLLEANAFGDYLPGLLHAGQSTYGAELREARRFTDALI
ncbi:MAG TPA: STM4014 family protein [Pirellulales bacterium]|nr:STM4014 family protein [Pirellulales bacterium]